MSTNNPSFVDLGVPADLSAILSRKGIDTPFDIQTATIPDALAGRDVLGRAPTGSGKTLAFGLPLIAGLGQAKPKRPLAMILSPTRELAEQIRRELEPLASVRDRSVLSIYGGVGFRDQLQSLRRGVDLIVACPGRLIDLLDQGALSLDAVRYVVVDEADRMADMGFLPAVRQLLDLTSNKRQTVLFSATLGREVQVLTKNYQTDAVTHEVGETEPDLSLVTHRFIKTDKLGKVRLAAQLIDQTGPTVIFCRTRHGVDRVAKQLKHAGVKAGWIHGGRSQNQRDAALQAFTRGKVLALVATDVAARGIHVDGVECVIHFDPPEDDKAYTHRSGRTARAGAGGVVVSFVNSDQLKDTRKLQKQIGLPFDLEETPKLVELPPIIETATKNQNGNAPSRSGQNRSGQNRSGQNRSSEGRSSESRSGQSRSGQSRSGQSRSSEGRQGQRRSEVASARGTSGETGGRDDRPRQSAPRPARSISRRAILREADASDDSTGTGSSRQLPEPPDWKPRPKNKHNATRGKTKGGAKASRSGKPRPKNKKGGPKATHRKGGGDRV